jgi:hypothetical protein
MHLHAIPHDVNFGLVAMWAGVVAYPVAVLVLLFFLAQHA